MDSQVQWRSLQQSDQPSTKVPKLHHLVDHQQSPASSALALFAHEPNINKATINPPSLSAFQDSTPTRYPMVGGYFSLAQWQELELQALIYKYMLAGAPVPLELILPIRRSLLTASPYYHHQQYQHLQPAMLQAGYWGRCVIDPEPGRCRRTDGKKWRCSREVVTGQKYCERHVHRGRDRSRKHVEIPTPTAASGLKPTLPSPLATTKEPHFTLSGPSPTLEILPLGQRHPDGKTANGYLPQGYCSKFSSTQELQGDKSDNRILRKFLDDWPRTQQELTPGNGNASSAASTTHLSISIPGNSSSDFSLKLSTGNGDKPGPGGNKDGGDGREPPPPANWSGWGSHGEASMGGPLAEVLRSSTSTPSPTSVLQKPHGSVSETSSAST